MLIDLGLCNWHAEDLYDLIPKESTLQCHKKWIRAVEDEKRKSKNVMDPKRVSVWKLLYRCMGNEYMLTGLCKPIWLTAVVLQVSLLSRRFLWKFSLLGLVVLQEGFSGACGRFNYMLCFREDLVTHRLSICSTLTF